VLKKSISETFLIPHKPISHPQAQQQPNVQKSHKKEILLRLKSLHMCMHIVMFRTHCLSE